MVAVQIGQQPIGGREGFRMILEAEERLGVPDHPARTGSPGVSRQLRAHSGQAHGCGAIRRPGGAPYLVPFEANGWVSGPPLQCTQGQLRVEREGQRQGPGRVERHPSTLRQWQRR